MRYFLTFSAIASILTTAIFLRAKGAQEEPKVPVLFAPTYQAGHELAGFSGRPMVMVFGDSRVAGWKEFLVECESEPEVASHLRDNFTGVFVDAVVDAAVFEQYGASGSGVVLIKDLRGPLLGILEEGYTCTDLQNLLNALAPTISTGPSPLYSSLKSGPEVLEDLVQNGEVALAEKAVRWLKRLEPGTSVLAAAEARATALGLHP